MAKVCKWLAYFISAPGPFSLGKQQRIGHRLLAFGDVATLVAIGHEGALGKRAVHDIIEIGRRLIEELAGHGNWLPWLEREFGWSEQTARNYMAVAERFKSPTVGDLLIDASALYLLAGNAN
jgi:hypothetical protein